MWDIVDNNNHVWSTTGQVNKFDRETWKTYTSADVGSPKNSARDIIVDVQGNIWVAFLHGGISKFDGERWENLNTGNSDLVSNNINSIVSDHNGSIWAGFSDGLMKISSDEIEYFITENSGLPDNYIYQVHYDYNNNLWINSRDGITKFNGSSWVSYNIKNSVINSSILGDMVSDSENNLWMIDSNGLLKFNYEDRSTAVEIRESYPIVDNFILAQNYPNPFNPKTIIKFTLYAGQFITLKVYNSLSREITTLIHGLKKAGNYNVEFDAKGLASGIYFYTLRSNDVVIKKKMLLIR